MSEQYSSDKIKVGPYHIMSIFAEFRKKISTTPKSITVFLNDLVNIFVVPEIRTDLTIQVMILKY